MSGRRRGAVWALCTAVLLGACEVGTPTPPDAPGLANPASVSCEEQGGELELRDDGSGGQLGICVFPDGAECEEWALHRGECDPGTGPA